MVKEEALVIVQVEKEIHKSFGRGDIVGTSWPDLQVMVTKQPHFGRHIVYS